MAETEKEKLDLIYLTLPGYRPWYRKRWMNISAAFWPIVIFVYRGGDMYLSHHPAGNVPLDENYFLPGCRVFLAIWVIYALIRAAAWVLSNRFSGIKKGIRIAGDIISVSMLIGMVCLALGVWDGKYFQKPYEGAIYLKEGNPNAMYIRYSHLYGSDDLKYAVYDETYLNDLTDVLRSYETTGKKSNLQTSNVDELGSYVVLDLEYYMFRPDPYVRVITYEKDGQIYVDQPNYGVFYGDQRIMNLIQRFDEVKRFNRGYCHNIDGIFTENHIIESLGNPESDTVFKFTLFDRETGEDVTDAFVQEYQKVYDMQDYETIWNALQEYRQTSETIPRP